MSSSARRHFSRRRFLQATLAAAGLAVFYTFRIEPHWLELVDRDLPIANLPRDLAGRRLVQLSDVHIGPQVPDDYVRETFRRVAALQPDLVVHTGDLVTYRTPAVLDRARSLLADLPRGRLGTIAIRGNHDWGHNWNTPAVAAEVAGLLEAAGATVLSNARTVVAGLTVIGLEDHWSGRLSLADALRDLDPAAPALVLNHNPDACDLPGWGDYRGWILAGHTHGGQCKPPFLPPPMLPVRNRRYTAGEFALSGGRRLYVNRGVGTLLPVRFNVRPEVTVFTLRRA